MTATATAPRPWEKQKTAAAPKPATAAKAAPAPAAKAPPAIVPFGDVAAAAANVAAAKTAATEPTTSPPAAGGNLVAIVDEFATRQAEIKKLEKLNEPLGEMLKALGPGEYKGTHCKVVISSTPTSRFDTAAFKAAFDADQVAKFYKSSDVVKATVKADL